MASTINIPRHALRPASTITSRSVHISTPVLETRLSVRLGTTFPILHATTADIGPETLNGIPSVRTPCPLYHYDASFDRHVGAVAVARAFALGGGIGCLPFGLYHRDPKAWKHLCNTVLPGFVSAPQGSDSSSARQAKPSLSAGVP
eukprot:TRINITY_DN44131_c0_g1_i1.p1 TRINITY_DN44131_c0_g1~~TRINITY_DN44131_c0_g1_i1.p1  ORF type:complete len:146 (-),score=0.30 TRINITY_DN44131_c0_g1_i1:5-442(-)